MTRDEHLVVSQFTLDEVHRLLDAISGLGTRVKIRWRWRPQLIDPDDELVLEAAINGRAASIVTFNYIHFARAAQRFGLEAISPREALRKVKTQ